MQYQVITQPDALAKLCDTLKTDAVAIDTEFVRTRTYYPELGLFQIFDGKQLALIDPVAIKDLTPLWQVLQNSSCTTILHAASEDLELIYQQAGKMPTTMHDTQLAAAFCGLGLSVGFNALCQELLQLSLDKDQARTNWLARPLTERQLDYAAADVLYLLPMYEKLLPRLHSQGRFTWFEEECSWLVQKKLQPGSVDDAYKDVANAWQLGRKELAVLQKLSCWREAEAKRRNLAVNFVVKELHLFKCAQYKPRSMRELDQLDLLQPEIRNHGKTLLRLVEEGMETPLEACPEKLQRLMDFPHYKSELKRLRQHVEEAAQQHQLPVELIASKKMIHQYLSWLWKCNDEQKLSSGLPRLLTGWRHQLLGDLQK